MIPANKIILASNAMIFLFLASFTNALAGALTVSSEIIDGELIPGQETTIFLTFKTTTAAPVRDIIYSVTAGPYITTDASAVKLGAMGGSSASQQTSFRVKADGNAITATSYVSVKVKYKDDEGDKETNLNVPVTVRRAPLVQIDSVVYSKNVIEPGAIADLTLNMMNRGQGPAKEATVTLNQSPSIFSIVGTSKQIFVGDIAMGGSKPVKYTLAVNPNADIGTYSIPVSISYKDETKTKSYDSDESVGFVISGDEQIVLIKNSQDVLPSGGSGDVNIEAVNIGKQNVRFLLMELSGTDGISVEPSKAYIGKLDSDDSDTSRLKITVDSSVKPGVYKINATMSYNDMFSNAYTRMSDISIEVSAQGKQAGLSSAQSLMAVAILAIIAYVFRRSRKARK